MMEEHTYLNFLSKHWSKLLLGFLAVASIAAWGERFFTANKSQSEHDFLVANQILDRFHKGETLPNESIETTEKILQRHPELHPKFDTMLAMVYLSQRNPSKGLPYARANLAHTLSPLYRSYAQTSLLIGEKRYQEAYTAAQSLQSELKNKGSADSTLYAMNLLRIVSLETEIGAQSTAWEELKVHPAYSSISPLFQHGALSFEDWHASRT